MDDGAGASDRGRDRPAHRDRRAGDVRRALRHPRTRRAGLHQLVQWWRGLQVGSDLPSRSRPRLLLQPGRRGLPTPSTGIRRYSASSPTLCGGLDRRTRCGAPPRHARHPTSLGAGSSHRSVADRPAELVSSQSLPECRCGVEVGLASEVDGHRSPKSPGSSLNHAAGTELAHRSSAESSTPW